MAFKNLKFVCTFLLCFLAHANAKAIYALPSNDASFPSQSTLVRRSPELIVQSQGFGGGPGGSSTSSTSLSTNGGSDESSQELDVNSNATGSGNNSASSTSLQFSQGGDDGYGNDGMTVQSNAVGVAGNGGQGGSQTSLNYSENGANGDNSQLGVQANAVGASDGDGSIAGSQTSLKFNNNDAGDNSQLDVQANAAGTGDENGNLGASQTSLQYINDDGEGNNGLNVQTDAVGVSDVNGIGEPYPSENVEDVSSASTEDESVDGNPDQQFEVQSGDGNIEVTDASHQTGNTDVESTNVGVASPDGTSELSGTSLRIDDSKEGDINLDTAALGSGGAGGSQIGLVMEDGQNDTDDLTVQSTTDTFGDSEEGTNGSRTIVQVNDEANDRTIDAQSIGVGIDNEYGTGGMTEDSIKYRDLDEENQETEIVDENGISRSVTRELSDVDVQNMSTGYNFISDDGTTTQTSTQTRKSSSTVQKKSYYTESSTIHGSEILIDQDGQPILSDQDGDHVVQTNIGDDQSYYVTGQGTQTLNQGEDFVVQTNLDHDQDSVTDPTTPTPNQGGDFVVQRNLGEDESYYVTGQQTQSLDQSQNVIQTNQNQDESYYLTGQQTQSLDQSQNVIQTNQNQDESYYLTGQQTQSLDQSQNVIQTNQNQDESYYLKGQQTQSLDQRQDVVIRTNQSQDESYYLTGQQARSIDQSQNYYVSSQQTQNTERSENYFVSNQQTQTVDQSQTEVASSQQPSTGAIEMDYPLLRYPPSSVCPENNRGPGVVCYYQASSFFEYENGFVVYPGQIVTDYCDVLVVSYAVLDIERIQIGAYSPDEERLFAEILKLKNERLKIILQLQYVAFYEQYVDILSYDDNILQFISSVVNYLQQWNFDGIEMPLMVPEFYDNVFTTAPIIKQRYPALIQNLKVQLQQNDLLLSVCLPVEPEFIDLAYDIQDLIEYVDWFSVNTLDYNVPEQGVLRHFSPLTPESLNDPFCIDYTVNYLIDQLQVPANKLIVNVPLYGSSFMLENYKDKTYGAKVYGRGPAGPGSHIEGFLTLSELCSLSQINWLNNPAIVTDYDDVPTLAMKVTYIRSRCLGGVGIHAITMDDPEGLLCGRGPLPFTRAISLAYNPYRDVFVQNEGLELINYIDPSTTNKYLV